MIEHGMKIVTVVVFGLVVCRVANCQPLPQWPIWKIYSNADGSVQFIVFEDTPSSLAGQTLIAGNGSTEHTYTFPSDVPCSMFLYDFAEIHKGVGRNT